MGRVRSFIAIPLSVWVKNHIQAVIEKLQQNNYPVRWINPQNAHITLYFLGHIRKAKIKSVAKVIHQSAQQVQPFPLTIGEISYFYREKHGKNSVVFLRVIDREKGLKQLFQIIRKSLKAEGFSPPRRIIPHITLGRIKKQRKASKSKSILADLASQSANFIDFLADRVTLYESSINRQKHYRVLAEFKLSS